jgi:hypothetical protein
MKVTLEAERKPLERFQTTDLYDVYAVEIQFRDKVCGGTPRNKELLEGWIKATTGHNDATTQQQVAEATDAMKFQETVEKSWNGFRGDETGLYIEARCVKALFKEAATMLRVTTQKIGSKQLFQHGFEIKAVEASAHPERIYLGTREPSGVLEGPIHVDTPQGPRTAIKRVDYVERPVLRFNVWVLATAAAEGRHVGEDEIVKMLTFGQENGIGADRSQGHGKFDVVGFEKIHKGVPITSKAPK